MLIVFLRIFLGIRLIKIGDARWQLEANVVEVMFLMAVWSWVVAWVVTP